MLFQHSFRKLIAWQKARELTLFTYQLTKKFPREETYGISSQLRRACYSVMANIAEGNNRNHRKEKIQFWQTAFASLTEADCFLELTKDLQYIENADYEKTLSCIRKTAFFLRKLINSMK